MLEVWFTSMVLGMQAGSLSIPRINLLPDRPSPYVLRDWNATAHAYDRIAFDLNAKGPFLPLIWRVPGTPNLNQPGFGMPSYVGNDSPRGKTGEALAQLGSLLGSTAAGIDKQSWVELTPQYWNPSEGTVLNDVGGKSGHTFWYELFPSIVFTQLASRYPTWRRGQEISHSVAKAWMGAADSLQYDFDHTSFDFATRKPFDNKLWQEPDSASAIAYLTLFEGLRSKEPRYLASSRKALAALEKRDTNPTYEVLTPYGVLAAAYLNAERGDRWPLPRFLDWCFDPNSPNRAGWGMIVGCWGNYDVGGLIGSTNDGGGYAFAMNSFSAAATIAPVARYDDRFSAPLAKWILNLTNAARLFYRDSLPSAYQSSTEWPGDKENGIAYEGLRREWDGKSPYATGDAKRSGWSKADLALYGGGYVGLLAALVHPTNVPMILRIDLRATDFLPVRAYPTALYWNPYDAAKTVEVPVGNKPVRLYDPVSNRFLTAKPTRGTYRLRLGPKQAAQVVQVPPTGAVTYVNNRTLVNGVTIDANNGKGSLPPRVVRARKDFSVTRAVARVSGGTIDWSRSEAIPLNGGAGSKMRADLRFAWDDQFLFFQLRQRAPSTATIEAPSVAELHRHWWDFEDVTLSFDIARERFPMATVPELVVGWSSTGKTGLAYSSDLKGAVVKTYGNALQANRVVVGRLRWDDLIRACGTHKTKQEIVSAGRQIGCQPMIVDGTFNRQAYVGGARFRRPTGFDRNSRTLVLEAR